MCDFEKFLACFGLLPAMVMVITFFTSNAFLSFFATFLFNFFPGLIRFFVSQLVQLGYGTPTDFQYTEDNVMSSITRYATRQRSRRVVVMDGDGDVVNGARTPYLVSPLPNGQTKPGYFVRHFSEEDNRTDPFVTSFIDSKANKDDVFLRSITRITVSLFSI
jgi:hypothetical protein